MTDLVYLRILIFITYFISVGFGIWLRDKFDALKERVDELEKKLKEKE